MQGFLRPGLCSVMILTGLAGQAILEQYDRTERPLLRKALASVPYQFGDWSGYDEPVAPDIIERAQTTDYLNRSYRSRSQPGLKFTLWINYSEQGTNLRHTPEICLPSSGWSKIESQTKTVSVALPEGKSLPITRLGYAQGDLVEYVGFWYYIFGEGHLEKLVRQLPITSRSSHGRTTRGSSMTVEIFAPGEFDPDGRALSAFVQCLVQELEPILPVDRAQYFTP